jgi:hypothetical protein
LHIAGFWRTVCLGDKALKAKQETKARKPLFQCRDDDLTLFFSGADMMAKGRLAGQIMTMILPLI